MARCCSGCAAAVLLILACVSLVNSQEPAEFATYRGNLASIFVPGADATIGQTLGDALTGWEYTLPLEFVRKGQAYMGSSTRLRRVMSDLMAGKPVSVTVLGGSISTGAVASRKQAATDPNDLWSLVRIYMQKNLDDSITFNNNARSATRSYITSLCLEKFLDDTSDLVFVEFIANDGSEMDVSYVENQKARFFERFLRNILRKPTAPAVVMMQFMVNEMAFPPDGQDGKPKRGYMATPEDTYYNLAQYYDIPTLSFRYATYLLGETGSLAGFDWATLMGPDRLHPADKGHKVAADLVVYMLQQTLIGLQLHPAGDAEAASLTAALPPPMYEGNEVGTTQPICAMGKNMTKFIVDDMTWSEAQNDDNLRYPTDGYETTTPNQPLTFEVDTTSPDGRPVTVFFLYTRAQTGIGSAMISCGNGCQCGPEYLDGSLPYDQVVTFINSITPTAAPACQINVALASNSTEGAKLRITGIAVTSDPGSLNTARIGEDKYMAWLLGENWAA
ncbi:SGNH hydrolase-type esterase domain-containing protein [Scenedesmus sp. NREL 46B-D3]|nr:SGNH hydrolase-type esterase domain-containing protein [Scenedesmus sp. NREL 46B-D3]